MTKFQFHVLIALGLLILADNAIGFKFHVYWCLVYVFTIFAIFDAWEMAKIDLLKTKKRI